MIEELARICEAIGIESTYIDTNGLSRHVSEETLIALTKAIGAGKVEAAPPPTIEEVLAEPAVKRCFVPDVIQDLRVWGITCQLGSLVSARNSGIGDFADLDELCRIAADDGADFVGVNPLHALYWSDPLRDSPFFPSNRRFLNPLYIALDWIDGYSELPKSERSVPTELKKSLLIDLRPIVRRKDRLLRQLFATYRWTESHWSDFQAFRDDGGDSLYAHALFEALSEAMVAEGHGVTPATWPASMAHRNSDAVAAFARAHRDAVDYHLWLQWLARRQLDTVQRHAREAGLRIGLYLDLAVGAAPDGSAAWADPDITNPALSIGAPPDPFSRSGQDWGLAPLSPVSLAALDGLPLAAIFAAATGGAGAIRIDHAMGLARLWLIPRGAAPSAGAYVRYPLRSSLNRLAEISHMQKTLVIGEDLGVVPEGFRPLMNSRNIHGYKVMLFERDASGFVDPRRWTRNALACFATHDMPTFAGWWTGADIDVRRSLGLLSKADHDVARKSRQKDRTALRQLIDTSDPSADLSPSLHSVIANSPCRLAALQIEDALGVTDQVNIPGTTSEYPNWRRRLPVALEDLATHPTFRAHTAAMRSARPR